jgi:hypothetical protein
MGLFLVEKGQLLKKCPCEDHTLSLNPCPISFQKNDTKSRFFRTGNFLATLHLIHLNVTNKPNFCFLLLAGNKEALHFYSYSSLYYGSRVTSTFSMDGKRYLALKNPMSLTQRPPCSSFSYCSFGPKRTYSRVVTRMAT